jgi:hypothetical protein
MKKLLIELIIQQFPALFPDAEGHLKKKVVLKILNEIKLSSFSFYFLSK